MRPWYMRGGSLQPERSKSTSPESRTELIFPEEAPNEDRIPEQLMYVPPGTPKNQEDASTPLKKILLWNGINSWGGTRPGRGVFIREKCPVSSCAVTTSRGDAATADLVLFKVRRMGTSFVYI